jgi:hypothetical protein
MDKISNENYWKDLLSRDVDCKKLDEQYLIPQLGLFAFSAYFIVIEIIQFLIQGWRNYFSIVWNYFDLIPPIMIISMLISASEKFTSVGQDIPKMRLVLAIVLFIMWLKALYFMRIYSSFAYLIRMIVQVFKDMKTFLVVLMVTIMAFSDAFEVLSDGNEPEN